MSASAPRDLHAARAQEGLLPEEGAVLREHHAPAKYPVGSYVQPRSGASAHFRRVLNGKPAIVIQTDAGPIVSAAKGAKIYKLLPIGGAETLTVEERYIMKARKVK